MPETALEIISGAELLRFQPNVVEINGQDYQVLTGYEGTGRCFWCGGELRGKLKRYCYGHMILYYRYFEWGSARRWCIERSEGRCANCGIYLGVGLRFTTLSRSMALPGTSVPSTSGGTSWGFAMSAIKRSMPP